MDFHGLTRKELQFFSKKNRIPANMTNVAMADALSALQLVEGLEEFTRSDTGTVAQTPDKIGSRSLYTSPSTAVRSSRRPAKADLESAQPATRTRGGRRRGGEEVSETPAPSTRRKASVPRKTDSAAREEASVQRTYATRRSARLVKKMAGLSLNEENGRSSDLFTEKSSTDVEESLVDDVSKNGVESKTKSDESFALVDGSEVLSDPRLYVQSQDEGDSKDVQQGSESGGCGRSNSADVEVSYSSEIHSDKKMDILLQNEGESKYEIQEDVSEGASHDLDNISVSDGLNDNKEGLESETKSDESFAVFDGSEVLSDPRLYVQPQNEGDSKDVQLKSESGGCGHSNSDDVDVAYGSEIHSGGKLDELLQNEGESKYEIREDVSEGAFHDLDNISVSDGLNDNKEGPTDILANLHISHAGDLNLTVMLESVEKEYYADQKMGPKDSFGTALSGNAIAIETESFVPQESDSKGLVEPCVATEEENFASESVGLVEKMAGLSLNGEYVRSSDLFTEESSTDRENASESITYCKTSDDKSSHIQQDYCVNSEADFEDSKIFPQLDDSHLATKDESESLFADKGKITPESIATCKTSSEKSYENQPNYCMNTGADFEDSKIFPQPEAQLATEADGTEADESSDEKSSENQQNYIVHPEADVEDSKVYPDLEAQLANGEVVDDVHPEADVEDSKVYPDLEAQLANGEVVDDGTDDDENADNENITPESIADRKTSGEESTENQPNYCVNLEVDVEDSKVFPDPALLANGDGTDADENSSEYEENAKENQEAATDERAVGVSSDSEHSVISNSDALAALEFSKQGSSNKLNSVQLESDIVAEHNNTSKEELSPVLEVLSKNQPLPSFNVTAGTDSKNPIFGSPKRICSTETTAETPRSQYKAKTLSFSGTVHLTPKSGANAPASIQVLDDSQSLTKKTDATSIVQRMNHLLDESCCKENIISNGTHAFDVNKESIGKNMTKHINQDKKTALNDMSLRQLRAMFKEQKLTISCESNDKPEVNGSKVTPARPALQALPENHVACDHHRLEDN